MGWGWSWGESVCVVLLPGMAAEVLRMQWSPEPLRRGLTRAAENKGFQQGLPDSWSWTSTFLTGGIKVHNKCNMLESS